MFYFAWVPDGGQAFSPVYAVEDEQVFSFSLTHNEGDFASLSVDVVNPRVGLLDPARSHWIWFSWRRPDNVLVPLFHGRLVGVPADMSTTTVTMDFIGRPEDFEDQKAALAESLKVYPFWDPIWIADESVDDPDVVLAARPQLWHIGRTDKTVTVSDVLNGEDGTITLDDTIVIADSLQFSYGEVINQVHCDATVSWDQRGFGEVDITDKLLEAFQKAGSKKYYATSYTGQGLDSTWPVGGTDIGGGWSVLLSSANLRNKTIDESDYKAVMIDPTKAIPKPDGFGIGDPEYEEQLAEAMAKPIEEARFYKWEFQPRFTVQYDGTRSRSEVLSFDLIADIQPLLYDADPAVDTIQIESNSLSEPIDPDGKLPIGSTTNNTFFDSDRADQAISYLLSMARSKILFAARAVNITFTAPFEQIVDISCRYNVILNLPDLPGGQAQGKVTSYSFGLNGNDGTLGAQVTIGCAIGRGNTLGPPSEGNPTYVIDDVYVEDLYQVYVGGSLSPIAGQVTYDKPSYEPVDDGLDLNHMTSDNCIAATPSTAVLELTPGSVGDVFVINGREYTIVDDVTAVDQVLVGEDDSVTARNIAGIINHDENLAGTIFDPASIANADVHAIYEANFVRITAWVPGPEGNSLSVSAAGTISWDGTHLVNGDDGLVVVNGESVQEDLLDDMGPVGSIDEAVDLLNEKATEVQLALKPIDGGPFETPVLLVVSNLMVPKMMDLE